ncbi:MAG: hypothetical protein V1802_03605 [Candidatus Aenigmatarchaeota archaeon]
MARKINLEIPDRGRKKIISREYKIYEEEERIASLPRTLYEKLCNTFAKAMKVTPDKDTKEKLQSAIDFTHLKTTPEGVASITLLFTFLISFPTLILIITDSFMGFGIPVGYGMMILLMLLPFVYYLYMYPLHLKKKYEVEVGSEIVTMVLYMALYLRNTPNMERAVKFASENLTGPLGFELRKLMWDLGIRKYITIEEAMTNYTNKWSKNKEFVQAIELLVSSLSQPGEKRLSMLDEAVDVILRGYRETAKHFNQSLRMPVVVVHALGIILPVMGLVLFPIVAVFLNVGAMSLFIGYDLILPIILFFIISNILEKRPVTYTRIDITENPDMPKEGMFRFRGKDIPAFPFGFITGAIISSIGILLLLVKGLEKGQQDVVPGFLIVTGIAVGFAIYYILLSRQRLKLRESTRQIESEFSEALFQIGNQVYSGTPIELSMQHSIERIENLKIKDLFSKALNNIRMLGMTFSQAFFDEEHGAIRNYPSKLIKSVMRIVIETTKRGVTTASVAMISVSRYLKGVHETQEDVKEDLSETISSLKFQLFFLSPLISGIVVTLAIIIIRILAELGSRLGNTELGVPFLPQFSEISITPFQFIVIIAIYLLETCFIITSFVNGIENGEDPIGRHDLLGYSLIIAFVVFAISVFATLAIFEPLITMSV